MDMTWNDVCLEALDIDDWKDWTAWEAFVRTHPKYWAATKCVRMIGWDERSDESAKVLFVYIAVSAFVGKQIGRKACIRKVKKRR